MRNLARGAVVTALALLGLVPIQSAWAAGTLDVVITGSANPEVAVLIADSWIELTATNTPAPPDDTVINFDTNNSVNSAEESCETVAGACSVFLSESAMANPQNVRAWVVDGGLIPPCLPMSPIPDAECDPTEGQDEAAAEGATPEPDDTDVVTLEWKEGTLNVEPEAAAAAPSTAVNLTATVQSTETPPRGLLANVDAEVISGPNNTPGPVPASVDTQCDTVQAGTCTLSYTGSATAGVDVLQAWVDENDDQPADPGPPAVPAGGDETSGEGYEGDASEQTNTDGAVAEPDITDSVDVNWTASQFLDVTPETSSKPTSATPSSNLTATVKLGATPQSGIAVAAAVQTGGANVGKTATCTTGANGTCVLNYAGTVAGIDKVRAAVDTDGNGQPNEGDSTEDLNEGTAPGGVAEPDTTDVVQITWTGTTQPTPPPPAVDTDCEQAKQKVAKLKKKLKKAKKADNEAKIKKLKKKLKKARAQKRAACAS